MISDLVIAKGLAIVASLFVFTIRVHEKMSQTLDN